MSNFLEAALHYASMGWWIFPLAPGQKTPITAHGCKDATTEEYKIIDWWKKWPNANIGLACGAKSGVYVLDIDVKGNVNGFLSLEEFPKLPKTVRQETPSGGAHLLFRSSVAPANRNSFRPGIDIRCEGYYIVLPPSTHPNSKHYAWTVECAPWEIALAEFPEFMRPATRAPWTTNTTTSSKAPTLVSTDTSVLQRASLYLATCDPAVQGQCGHNKLLYAASRMIHGFLLSDSQTYDLLEREYNPRCVPPWDLSSKKDVKDFQRKIEEARRLQPNNVPGWLLEDQSYQQFESTVLIDVNGLCGNSERQPSVNPPSIVTMTSGGFLSQDQEYQYLVSPVGLLGDICSWINNTALKEQPFLSLACALVFLGVLFGRKVRDDLGSRTNLYCMGVAPSSAGKAHAMNQIRRLAGQSGCTSLLGGDSIASDSAIEERVHREPATMFMWDEIGHLLAHIRSGVSQHHAQIVSLLMKLYSAAGNIYLGKEYADAESQRSIIQPCCGIYGTSTVERFASGISPAELQDGWLSRCLVFYSPHDMPKKRGRIECPVPEAIIEQVKHWSTIVVPSSADGLAKFVAPGFKQPAPDQFVIPTDADAENVFIQFDNAALGFGRKNPMVSCLWGKAEENARRIALIVACGDQGEEASITIQHASYACRLVKYIMDDFCKSVVPEIVTGDVDSRKRKLLAVIDGSGQEGISKSDLTRSSQWIKDKSSRTAILEDLIEAGEVAFKSTPAPGNRGTTLRYWTANHYAKKFE